MIYFIRLMAIVVCLCASGEVVAKVPRGLDKAKVWKDRDVTLRGLQLTPTAMTKPRVRCLSAWSAYKLSGDASFKVAQILQG